MHSLRLRSLVWPLFLSTALFQAVGNFFYFVVLKDPASVQVAYGITKVVMLAAPFLLLWLGLALPKFSLTARWPRSLVFGFGSGALIMALIMGVYAASSIFFENFEGPILAKLQQIGIQKSYLAAALGISTFHALFEEFYWRWYVVKGLETRLSPLASALAGNALFTIHHFFVLSQFMPLLPTLLLGICVGLGGYLWSWMYHRTGSLLAPWISHICADLAIFTVGYLLIN